MIKIITRANQIKKRLISAITMTVEFVALNLVYFIGVGLTSLFAKLLGKKFYSSEKGSSTWQKYHSKHMDKMF